MKYLRTYKLTVFLPDGDTVVVDFPLTIDINIVNYILSSANAATINIYNLSAETRRRIFHDWINMTVYMGVELTVGYTYGQSATIFKGNIRSASSVRQGTDWITTIDAWDGGYAITNGHTSRTVAAGYTMQKSINDVIQDMPNVKPGIVSAFDGKKLTDERGSSLEGPSWDVIKNLNIDGLNFISDEKVYCMKKEEYLSDQSPIIIKAETGLLGTPQRAESLVKVRTIFEPMVKIGRMVQLESAEPVYNGTYRVDGITHSGVISGASCGSLITALDLYNPGTETSLPSSLPGAGGQQ